VLEIAGPRVAVSFASGAEQVVQRLVDALNANREVAH